MNLKFQITATPDDGVNLAPSTGAVAMFNLQQALKQAGWVVIQWSDGTTMTTSSAGWSSGASGAGGAANNSAWVRITDPAAVREIVIQRGTANTTWRAKISHSAKFTGGSPSATVAPTATDQLHFSTGADTPTFVTFFIADGTYKQHLVADADAPYDFAMVLVPNGGGTCRGFYFLNGVSGRYPSGEVAPYLVGMPTNGLTSSVLSTTTASTCAGQGWYRKGLSGEAAVSFRAGAFAFGGTTLVDGLGTNPINGSDNPIEIVVGRLASDGNGGFKIFLNPSLIRWSTVPRNDADFVDPSDLPGSRFAVWDQVMLRFPPGVTPTT